MKATGDNLSFSFATAEDDAELRALCAATSMPGVVQLGFAHKPSFLAGAGLLGASDRVLVAREKGRLVAFGRCVIQSRWINGAIRRCGYLGELRLHPEKQGRWDILGRGYAFLAENCAACDADIFFTSILADNGRARRLFERGVRRLPRYTPVADYTTLVVRTKSRAVASPCAGVEIIAGDSLPACEIVRFLNDYARDRNFGIVWPDDAIATTARHGLTPSDLIVVRRHGRVIGCAAIWDQRSFRQVVVHGYAPWIRLSRRLINLVGPLTGWPGLPRPGAALALGCLSPLAVDPTHANIGPSLVRAALAGAAQRGLDFIALGADSRDPIWSAIGRLRSRSLRSVIYTVEWPGMATMAPSLAPGHCSPDLAFL